MRHNKSCNKKNTEFMNKLAKLIRDVTIEELQGRLRELDQALESSKVGEANEEDK